MWATDNGANSTVTWYLYPAVNTDGSGTYAAATTGYVDVDAAMLTTGSIPSSYFAGAAAQGDVQNTGTLTVGKSYHIITTEADHFGAGVLADQYIIAAATTALDANNTVREHGTVRLSEAGTTVWTMLDSLKNIFSDAEGAATSEGAVVFQWTPGYAEASGTGTVGILGWNNSTSSGIYTTHGSDLKITDGTNTATVTKAWVANTTYTVVAYWSKTLDILNIGVLDAGSWTWGTEQAYDDAQPVGTNLVPFYGNEYPNHIGHVDFWNSAMTQSFFEGKY
uniref:Uncharacterized protein n=2 Tax=viral metagenome TaxID=1070528 RepID=A0A6M3IVB5_9ZZZZ